MHDIKVTAALLHPDGSVLCAITRNGTPDLYHAVRDRDHVEDNKEIVDLLAGVFVETWTVAKQREMVTTVYPGIRFSFDEDKAQARRELADKVGAARRAITRDPIRYKVAHAAMNGDSVAQGKIGLEAEHRGMDWKALAGEIIKDEHEEERRSFALSGIAAAGLTAINAAISEPAVRAAMDDHIAGLAKALTA